METGLASYGKSAGVTAEREFDAQHKLPEIQVHADLAMIGDVLPVHKEMTSSTL